MTAYDIGPFVLEGASFEHAPDEHVAIPSPEVIRYAEQLRLQLRESYLRQSGPPSSVLWCIGAD